MIEPKTGWNPEAPVVLFLHGGGFVMEAAWIHWRAIQQVVKETGAQVWVLVYPQLPIATIVESTQAVVAAYRFLLQLYLAKKVTILGDSAGATLALTLCHWLKRNDSMLPLPGKLVLLSPGPLVIPDAELRSQAEAIEANDFISLQFLDTLVEMMQLSSKEETFYLNAFEGDFSGFPPLFVFAGTRETFYPAIHAWMQRLQKISTNTVRFYPGIQMCHDWASIPFVKESKIALSKMISIAKKGVDSE